jgi:hypothetical protein
LMWTRTDNLEEINWGEANQYCEDLTLGDYSDWRLPTIEQLEKLYDPQDGGKYKIRKLFRLTAWRVWSSKKVQGSGSASDVYFNFGGRYYLGLLAYSGDGRALCVRGSGE